jgi:GntR family transcriptional repressor for pyruvate dehydrogenase complex
VTKIAQRLFFDIVRDIAADGLSPGDRLPAQTAMAQGYGVSLIPLREALRMLELSGLISLRPGLAAGTLSEPSGAGHLAPLLMAVLCLRRVSYREILDACAIAEPLLAATAAARGDREAVIAEFAPFLEARPRRRAEAPSFREAVARAAGNPALELVAQALTEVVAGLQEGRSIDAACAQDEGLIAQTILAGDRAEAYRLMEAHVRAEFRDVLERTGRRPDEAFTPPPASSGLWARRREPSPA